MKKVFRVIEILTPVVEWQKGGTYATCPNEWLGKTVRVTPEGAKRSFEAEVHRTGSGGAYVLIDKELIGKNVRMKVVGDSTK